MKLIWQDYIFILGILFNLGALAATYGVVGSTVHAIGSAGYNIEGNFINRILLQIPALQLVELAVMWGLFSFMYISARKYLRKHPTSQNLFKFNTYVLMLFFMLLIDFLSDFGIVLRIFGL